MTTPAPASTRAATALLLAVLLGLGALLVVAAPAFAGTNGPSHEPTPSATAPQPTPSESATPGPEGNDPTATAVELPSQRCGQVRRGTEFVVELKNVGNNERIEIKANNKTYQLRTCTAANGKRYPTYRGTLVSVSGNPTFSLDGGREIEARAASAPIRFTMRGGTMNYPRPSDGEDGFNPPEPTPTPTAPEPTDEPTPSPSESPERTPSAPPKDDPEEAPDRPSPTAPQDNDGNDPPRDPRGPANGNGGPDSGGASDESLNPGGRTSPENDYSDPVPRSPDDSADSPDQINGPQGGADNDASGEEDQESAAQAGLSVPMVAVPLVALLVIGGLFLVIMAMRRRKAKGNSAH